MGDLECEYFSRLYHLLLEALKEEDTKNTAYIISRISSLPTEEYYFSISKKDNITGELHLYNSLKGYGKTSIEALKELVNKYLESKKTIPVTKLDMLINFMNKRMNNV